MGIAILGLATSCFPQAAFAGIDLTPRFIDTFVEGATFQRVYFRDGELKVGLSLNRETEVGPESGGALFRFRKLPGVTFLITRSRLSPQDPFESSALERYREAARRLLPIQAANPVIREEFLFPYPINDWKSYRFMLSFDLGGERHIQSVTFLNLNASDQIVLVTSAPEKDFDEAAHRSHQIIRTWQELLPGDEGPADSN